MKTSAFISQLQQEVRKKYAYRAVPLRYENVINY